MVDFVRPTPISKTPAQNVLPANEVDGLVQLIKGSESVNKFTQQLNNLNGEITAFQTYRLIEVIMLSDRSIPDKNDFLQKVGEYVLNKAKSLELYIPNSRVQLEYHQEQLKNVGNLLNVCSNIQNALARINAANTEIEKVFGLAGLQDNIRKAFQDLGIPVEDRSSYTNPCIPGHDFLNGSIID